MSPKNVRGDNWNMLPVEFNLVPNVIIHNFYTWLSSCIVATMFDWVSSRCYTELIHAFLSRLSTVFRDVSPIKLEESFNPLLKAIIYSASWARKSVNCLVSNKGAQGTEHGVERIHKHYNNKSQRAILDVKLVPYSSWPPESTFIFL